MKYAVAVPNLWAYADLNTLIGLARDAEDAGWDAFFLWDHVVGDRDDPTSVVDPWIALTAIACATKKIQLGTAITPLSRRSPLKLARETVTLDIYSNGRLILGIGFGSPPDDFEAEGDYRSVDQRDIATDEALEVLRSLWRGGPVNFEGEQVTIKSVTLKPLPVRQGGIPVWCGGYWRPKQTMVSRAMQRALRVDGFMPLFESTPGAAPRPLARDEFAQCVRLLRNAGVAASDEFVFAAWRWVGEDSPGEVAGFSESGANWWIVSVPWGHSVPDELRRAIGDGPPI